MTTSNEHNNAPAVPSGLLQKLDASIAWLERGEVLPGTPACIGLDDIKVIRALLTATPTPAPAQDEPFGHFRVEPFGWTDCAEDDEGAIALYERPQEVGLTASQFDLICQAIDKADTATMEGDYMLDSDDCIAVVRVMQVLFDIEALREKQVAKLDYESMYCWLTAGKRGDWIWNHVLTDEEKNLGNDINTVVIAALRAKGQS